MNVFPAFSFLGHGFAINTFLRFELPCHYSGPDRVGLVQHPHVLVWGLRGGYCFYVAIKAVIAVEEKQEKADEEALPDRTKLAENFVA